MTINYKFISYLMAFIAGIEWGREHPWLCFMIIGAGLVSYWYIKHGHLSSEEV